MLVSLCHSVLKSPVKSGFIIAGLSAFSLAFAYTGEYGFGLEPCILCLYQRIPFALALLTGLAAALYGHKKHLLKAAIALDISAIALLLNALLAFHHTGVEFGWWASFIEECMAPSLSGSADDLLSTILSQPTVSCSEPVWSFYGITMAQMNVAFSGGLGIFASIAMAFTLKDWSIERRKALRAQASSSSESQ